MTDSVELSGNNEPLPESEVAGEGWSGADIDEAYLKALQAMEDVPWQEEFSATDVAGPSAIAATAESPQTGPVNHNEAPAADDSAVAREPPVAVPSENPVDAPVARKSSDAIPAPGLRLAQGTARFDSHSSEERPNVSPAQVIEAALFVGGGPLTARKISGMLHGSYGPKEVEQVIDDLNDAYVAQARPYEIRLGDGGYRLELRPEYDRLRNRVYGSGPREVRLSQDVLEVLALVAYRQPISAEEIEKLGKQNAGNLLRQLLRRDLIAFERGPRGRKDVLYHTTPRFLSVFGLATIEELPQAEDLARK